MGPNATPAGPTSTLSRYSEPACLRISNPIPARVPAKIALRKATGSRGSRAITQVNTAAVAAIEKSSAAMRSATPIPTMFCRLSTSTTRRMIGPLLTADKPSDTTIARARPRSAAPSLSLTITKFGLSRA